MESDDSAEPALKRHRTMTDELRRTTAEDSAYIWDDIDRIAANDRTRSSMNCTPHSPPQFVASAADSNEYMGCSVQGMSRMP